jgi:hypothetical protein
MWWYLIPAAILGGTWLLIRWINAGQTLNRIIDEPRTGDVDRPERDT